jgi:hypothetical protein
VVIIETLFEDGGFASPELGSFIALLAVPVLTTEVSEAVFVTFGDENCF